MVCPLDGPGRCSGARSGDEVDELLDAGEERRRVLPVIEAFGGKPVISIDTYKAAIGREAIARGASIINDVSALRYDPALATVAAETGAAIVLMVLGITLMGESLNDLADPRLRTRRRAKRKTKAGRGAEQAPTTTNDEVTA